MTAQRVASVKRAHTGRARNQQVRQAILDATITLLTGADEAALTIDAIAAHAGVGKQTIYRWWPNKAAVIIEALTETAHDRVPDVDTGNLADDLQRFLVSTVRVVGSRSVTQALRALMADALHDAQATEVLRAYTSNRRSTLSAILHRGVHRGELGTNADIDLAVEQAFGFIWYRLLLGHAPLNRKAAVALSDGLLRQLQY